MLQHYIALVRSKLDYGCIVYGSACKSYIQMLDPVHSQGLRLCLGAFRTSHVESKYAHKPSLGARCAKLYLQYASKIKTLYKLPTHDAVCDTKFMKWFHEDRMLFVPFGLCIKHFVRHFGNSFIFGV